MDQFEFFFTFYGLLLGLALAELLLGFANALRERTPPKWGWYTPLLGLVVLIEISATFLDAWRKLQGIELDLPSFALPTMIGIAYFVSAVMTVPRHIEDWQTLDDYFLARRRWTVGLLVVANILHFIPELPFVAAASGQAQLAYAAVNAWLLGFYLLALFARRRWLILTGFAGVLLFFAFVHGQMASYIFESI